MIETNFLIWPISLLGTYLLFTREEVEGIKKLLYKVFWINRLTNAEKKHIFGFEFLYKSLCYFAKVSMYFYTFNILNLLLSIIINFQSELILMNLINLIFIPIAHRIVVGFQIFIHGIE